MTINVFSLFDDKGEGRHPLYVSEKGPEKVIDLLFWDDHYAWIKNFRRFMADLSSHNTLFWCRRCLGHFDNAAVLSIHRKYCEGLDSSGQILLLPDKSTRVKFANKPYVPSVLP